MGIGNVHVLSDRKVDSGAQDPLLSALVDKLPPAGSQWSAIDRAAWLEMMGKAFDVVYGASGGPKLMSSPAPARPRPASRTKPKAAKKARRPMPPKPLGPAFFIDKQGFARKAGGDRILPAQVLSGELVDLRGEKGDLDRITWADDAVGIPRGLQLDITIG